MAEHRPENPAPLAALVVKINTRRQRGVTLVEIAVGITAILLVATAMLPVISNLSQTVRLFREQSDEVALRAAMQSYYANQAHLNAVTMATLSLDLDDMLSESSGNLNYPNNWTVGTGAQLATIILHGVTVAFHDVVATHTDGTQITVRGAPFIRAALDETYEKLKRMKSTFENYYRQRARGNNLQSPLVNYFTQGNTAPDANKFYFDANNYFIDRVVRSQEIAYDKDRLKMVFWTNNANDVQEKLGFGDDEITTPFDTTIIYANNVHANKPSTPCVLPTGHPRRPDATDADNQELPYSVIIVAAIPTASHTRPTCMSVVAVSQL